MLDDVDRVVVACLVDNQYPWSTISGLYDRAYPIAARLIATGGSVDDVVYAGMPTVDADLALIIADWMRTVAKHRTH